MWNHNAFILTEKARSPKSISFVDNQMKVFCMTSLGGWLAHIMLPTHFKSPEEMSLCEAAFNANHSETLKHMILSRLCVKEHSAALHSETLSHIFL